MKIQGHNGGPGLAQGLDHCGKQGPVPNAYPEPLIAETIAPDDKKRGLGGGVVSPPKAHVIRTGFPRVEHSSKDTPQQPSEAGSKKAQNRCYSKIFHRLMIIL